MNELRDYLDSLYIAYPNHKEVIDEIREKIILQLRSMQPLSNYPMGLQMRKKDIPRLTAKQVEALSPVNGCVKVSEDGCNIQEYKDGEWVIVKVLQSRIDISDVTPLSLPDDCGFEKLILPLEDSKDE